MGGDAMADNYESSPEELHNDTPQDNAEGRRWARPAIGFLLVMAIIGSVSALAWRAYADRPWMAAQDLQVGKLTELKATIQQLENTQQQLVQRVNALQLSQQQLDHARQVDVQRISEQMTAITKDVEKAQKKAAAKQPDQKRTSVADSKPKNSTLAQTSNPAPSASATNTAANAQR